LQIIKTIFVIYILSCYNLSWAQSTGGHGGHGGGGAGTPSGTDCIKAKISRYNPEHLTTVAPGATFSFAVSGANGPGHMHVSIKQQPIEVSVVDKETFYWVKGTLPTDIRDGVVRISVNVKAKFAKCDTEGGWLLKISE